jgi:hypothetical protein
MPFPEGLTHGDHSYTILKGHFKATGKTQKVYPSVKPRKVVDRQGPEARLRSARNMLDIAKRIERLSPGTIDMTSDWPTGSGDGRGLARLTAKGYKTTDLERSSPDRLQLSERQVLSVPSEIGDFAKCKSNELVRDFWESFQKGCIGKDTDKYSSQSLTSHSKIMEVDSDCIDTSGPTSPTPSDTVQGHTGPTPSVDSVDKGPVDSNIGVTDSGLQCGDYTNGDDSCARH